jgi:hypothetical protein
MIRIFSIPSPQNLNPTKEIAYNIELSNMSPIPFQLTAFVVKFHIKRLVIIILPIIRRILNILNLSHNSTLANTKLKRVIVWKAGVIFSIFSPFNALK